MVQPLHSVRVRMRQATFERNPNLNCAPGWQLPRRDAVRFSVVRVNRCGSQPVHPRQGSSDILML
jgi:hypothetical protein